LQSFRYEVERVGWDWMSCRALVLAPYPMLSLSRGCTASQSQSVKAMGLEEMHESERVSKFKVDAFRL
jgi:hypothetical protein